MITVRKSNERGHANHGWLDTHHSFSFASYYDPKHMGFRSLRVINEDRVSPGRGFGAHPHENMEILTYVLDGALAHKDSMGNTEVLRANEFQRITAGTGIVHSEFNASTTEPVHFMQIWIEPAKDGLKPSYEQIAITDEDKNGRLKLIAAPEGAPLKIHQDAKVLVGAATGSEALEHTLAPKRSAWVHVIRGEAKVNGASLAAGDAVALTNEEKVTVTPTRDNVEVIVFDLA
jgi:redox-sensitive bicupin YhaK (pirin superfamily)